MFSSHRRNVNTISEINDEHGKLVSSFEQKAKVRKMYFQKLFQEPEGCPVREILRVLRLFPKMVFDEMNGYLVE